MDDVTVENDHKPQESILRKPLFQSPPILQKLLLRLQKYTFEFKYVPGKDLIIADTLSRAYLTYTKEWNKKIGEELETYEHTVFIEGVPIARHFE
jgi:hypothetical protein